MLAPKKKKKCWPRHLFSLFFFCSISKVVKLKVTHFGTVDSHSYFYIRRSCRRRFGNRVNMRSLRADWTTMLLFISFYFISHFLHYFFFSFWLGLIIYFIIVWLDWNLFMYCTLYNVLTWKEKKILFLKSDEHKQTKIIIYKRNGG